MQFRALGVTAVMSLAFVCLASTAFAQPAKLLFSQVEVRGSVSNADFDEYVVIKNPGSSAVDLSNVYLSDATFANGDQYYYNLPNDALPIGGGGFNDFVARFPDGAMIGPGEEITISLIGSDSFESTYGISPHYELYEDGSSADNIPDMREARPGSLVDNTSQLPGLSNSGEVIVLFYWDGASDLVTDLDYVVWGDKNEAVDKTGISIDGPDGGSDATAYANDTSVSSQDGLGASPTGTFIRVDDNEGSQASSGSNGVGGRDETSENLTATFTSNTDGVPPGQVPEDTTPPTLLSASGAAGNSNVDLLFSEGLGAGATTTSNYSVFPTASPGSPIAVTAAETGGDPSTVNLTLASSLETGTSYTVEVTGVQDMAGNTLVGTATALFNTGVGDGFAVVAAFPFGPSHIGVAFSQDVNASQATNPANYTVTFGGSGATISSIQLQDNGSTAILNFSSPLPQNTAIQVTAANITSSTGGSLESGGPFAFNTGSETIMGIDQVHADVGSLDGQVVTVYGQVYMPATVQGSQISGYIQDGTGRGLNIFDFTTTVPVAVSDRGKVVKLTGTVDLFFTTVELTGFSATEVASDIPFMGPRVLSVGEAAGPQWEGTYIQTTSTLSAAPAASGSNNFNYEAGGITFRVRNNTGINAGDFSSGDEVTGAGAGSAFQSTFQITVGNADDFFKGGGGPDTTPPSIVSASGADRSITVNFSEAVTGGSFTVTETASSTSVPVTSSVVSGSRATISTGEDLTPGTSYTVAVNNVMDLAGNPLPANSTVQFVTSGQPGNFQVVGVFQFGPRHIGVAYGARPNSGQATDVSNYSISPTITVSSATLQDNGQLVILNTSSDLPQSTAYTVTVSGVTSSGGDPLEPALDTSFTSASETVMGIDEIHANSGSLEGQTVTVFGQVFMPATTQGSQISGYIQDGTGRGLNIFDFTTTPPSAVSSNDKVVKITGEVDVFFTTIEIIGFTATEVASGMPKLGPRVLSVSDAASSQWEGTYIQTTSTLTAAPAPSGSNNFNYEAGGITFRVRNNTGINASDFSVGDEVTAAGAGGAFQSTFQINVGLAEDFMKGSGQGDTTPPAFLGASGIQGETTISLTFSETLGAGATSTGNYTVAGPGGAVSVLSAFGSGSNITLTVGEELASGAYQVTVSNVQDLAGNVIAPASTISFTPVPPAAFTATGAFQFGADYIGIGFSKDIEPSVASVASNYSFTPSLSIESIRVQENGQTVIIKTNSDLPSNQAYTVALSGLSSTSGDNLTGASTLNFSTVSGDVINIEDIHADTGGFDGQNVTVIGQVFIPVGARGGTPSGYMQDGSGRGLNLFGGSTAASVNTLGNVVSVSGSVELFFETVEVTNYTATVLATEQPHLGAVVLTASEASSSAWEGTYIEVTSDLVAIITTGVGTGSVNFEGNDGTGNITYRRAGSGLSIDPNDYQVGDTVTGRGAGGAFQTTFQVVLGNNEDFFIAGAGPPELLTASGFGGSSTISLRLSEPVQPGSVSNVGNYRVFETQTPANVLSVNGASLDESGTVIDLSLAQSLVNGVSYTVEVSGLIDLENTPIEAGSRVSFSARERPLAKVRVTVPAATLIKDLRGEGEIFPITVEGEAGSRIVVRIFDLQGRVVRILGDTVFEAGGSGSQPSLEFEWDGRDETFELVPTGMYICHAATTDLNGKLTADQAPVVVAVRLD